MRLGRRTAALSQGGRCLLSPPLAAGAPALGAHTTGVVFQAVSKGVWTLSTVHAAVGPRTGGRGRGVCWAGGHDHDAARAVLHASFWCEEFRQLEPRLELQGF